eukprot:4989087-Amphidinium_carterae.2
MTEELDAIANMKKQFNNVLSSTEAFITETEKDASMMSKFCNEFLPWLSMFAVLRERVQACKHVIGVEHELGAEHALAEFKNRVEQRLSNIGASAEVRACHLLQREQWFDPT